MTTPNTLDALREEVNRLRGIIDDLKSVVFGPRHMQYQGLTERLRSVEEQMTSVKKVQDTFIDEQKRIKEEKDKKDRFRARMQVAVLSSFGAVLAGIVVELFVLIIGIKG